MKKIILICGLICCLFYAFGKDQISFIPKTFTVIGKVIPAGTNSYRQTIEFSVEDLVSDTKKYIVQVDSNAHFRIELPIYCTQEIYLSYGILTSLLAIPGQDLQLEIHENGQNHPTDTVIIIGGKAATPNRHLFQFKKELPNQAYIFQQASDAVSSKSPEEYQQYVTQREKEYRAFAKTFNKQYHPDPCFLNWQKDFLTYGSWNNLLRYRWEHPLHLSAEEQEKFQMPENYFDFLKNYDPNECSIFSMAHFHFLHEFYLYALTNPKEQAKLAQETFQNQGIVAGARILRSMLQQATEGFTRELFLTTFYLDALAGKQVAEFDTLYAEENSFSPFFVQAINKEYETAKQYLTSSNTSQLPLKEINSTLLHGLMDTLQRVYAGKVIYVDFWAPWCSPCMMEMPHSQKIQEHFTGQDVVFLFLANRCKDDFWKSTIANEKLGGEHIKLTDDQFAVLSSELGINSIPHYTLIDKKGNIVQKNAPRPSEKDSIITLIEQLLK